MECACVGKYAFVRAWNMTVVNKERAEHGQGLACVLDMFVPGGGCHCFYLGLDIMPEV